MGDEGTNIRLAQLEKDNDEKKIADKITADKIVVIEKINIRQEIILNSIMWSLKIIAGGFITFVGTNLYMYLSSK